MDSTVHISTDSMGVMILTLDVPGRSVNSFTQQQLNDLADAILVIERDNPIGVVFASAKAKSFSAGADLYEVREMPRERLTEYLSLGQSLFDQIAHLPMTTVAAINGDCLGGGCELALACKYRVMADRTDITIGLPEVKIGLIPAWGGTTRLPRLIGLTRALPMLLAGKTLPPRKAQKIGLVDEVVRPEALLAAATRIANRPPQRHRPMWRDRTLAKLSLARHRVLHAASKQTLAMTHGNYPAPLRIPDVIEANYAQGIKAGLAAERNAIGQLIETDTTRNLMRLFFLRQSAKRTHQRMKKKSESDSSFILHPSPLNYAAVIGGGTMGAGIAHALIRAGLFVRLVEVSPMAASAALERVKHLLDDDVAAGRLDKLAARHTFNRLSPTTDWTGIELADIAIEAVAETIEAKRDVFARLDRHTRPSAVLASNTSSLRIDDMAAVTLHPERVIGLHFFNPVPKMPLAEIVRGKASDDASIATAFLLVSRLGKTPIVCKDAPGFVVNRILTPYLAEAMSLAAEGTPIVVIDDAMKRWGMPMGPFELLDEIGLDIIDHVLQSMNAKPPASARAALHQAMKNKWLGKKSGCGFYIHHHGESAHKLELNQDLAMTLRGNSAAPAHLDHAQEHIAREAIAWRLVLPMVNEAAKLMEEGVIDSADAIDLATVLGLGLAPFRGGLMNFAESVGVETIVNRLDELKAEHGDRFAAAKSLRDSVTRVRETPARS